MSEPEKYRWQPFKEDPQEARKYMRRHFACYAMQGILAAGHSLDVSYPVKDAAIRAVECANALIAEIEKQEAA